MVANGSVITSYRCDDFCHLLFAELQVNVFNLRRVCEVSQDLQNDMCDSPQLLLIHTGTNDLSLTTLIDVFISDQSLYFDY